MDRERERQVLRDRLLGWSFQCAEVAPGVDTARDLTMTVGPSGRDFARVRGIDNLGQSLTIALTTMLGADIFNSGFGFDGLRAMVEETNPVLVRERIRIAVIQVLRRDARVRRIIDVNLDDTDSPSAGASPRELRIKVGFETVTGDQAAADLGRVATNG